MQIFGWLGFAFFQIFYLPQTVRMLRTKNVEGLSLTAWLVLWSGLFSYVLYSVYVHDVIFVLGNLTGLLQTSLQISLILLYRRKKN